jgi:TetR/AcrR family acrAB operon transcriptional repressor
LKRTKEEAEQTKKNLINIALREMVQTGWESITLEGIAAKAGVTRGAIYWHFNNKEDLLDSLIKMKDIESLEIMENIFNSEMPVMKKIYELVMPNFPVYKTHKEMKNYAKLKMDLYTYYLRYGDNRKIGKTFSRHISLLIKQGQKENVIKKEVNADEAAHIIFSLVGGLYMRFNQSPSKFKTLQSLSNIVKRYIKQLEK